MQRKYNEVRLKSLNPITEIHKDLKKISTRTDQPSKDLVLSRIKHGTIGDLNATSRRKNIPLLKVRGPHYEDISAVENNGHF